VRGGGLCGTGWRGEGSAVRGRTSAGVAPQASVVAGLGVAATCGACRAPAAASPCPRGTTLSPTAPPVVLPVRCLPAAESAGPQLRCSPSSARPLRRLGAPVVCPCGRELRRAAAAPRFRNAPSPAGPPPAGQAPQGRQNRASQGVGTPGHPRAAGPGTRQRRGHHNRGTSPHPRCRADAASTPARPANPVDAPAPPGEDPPSPPAGQSDRRSQRRRRANACASSTRPDPAPSGQLPQGKHAPRSDTPTRHPPDRSQDRRPTRASPHPPSGP
jgi:hypothetical protein